MRSELEQTRLIDQYMFGLLSEPDKRAFETQLVIDSDLADKLAAQQSVHRLIRFHGRQKARNRFEAIFHQLLTEKEFSQQIHSIFT